MRQQDGDTGGQPIIFPTEKKVRHIGPCILGAVKPPRLNKDPRECDVVCPSVYKPVCGSDGAFRVHMQRIRSDDAARCHKEFN